MATNASCAIVIEDQADQVGSANDFTCNGVSKKRKASAITDFFCSLDKETVQRLKACYIQSYLMQAHYFDLRSDKKSSYGYETHKMCAESALTLQIVVMNAQWYRIPCSSVHPHHAQSRVRVYADLLFSSYISRFLQRIMMTMAHILSVYVYETSGFTGNDHTI